MSKTSLVEAVKHFDLEQVSKDLKELLLRHRANPDVSGKDGRTVRNLAARKRDKRYLDAIGDRRV